MKYAVKKDGQFNGVAYDEINSNIIAYHAQYDETLHAVDGISKDSDGVWSEIILETPSAEKLKLIGVDFNGVMCSATKEDMWGLKSVRDWVQSGQDVNFKFDNGNTVVLTSANLAAFETVWIPFRASFF